MPNFALIDGTAVVNRAVASDLETAETLFAPLRVIEDDAGHATIGGSYSGGTFYPPSVPPSAPTDYGPIVAASFAAGLRGKAATLAKKGQTAQAMALLLQAQRIDPNG